MRALDPAAGTSFLASGVVVWTLSVASFLDNPTTNLLRSSTATNSGEGEDVGLPGGVTGGCGETDGFGPISVVAIVLVKEQPRRTKIYEASDRAV